MHTPSATLLALSLSTLLSTITALPAAQWWESFDHSTAASPASPTLPSSTLPAPSTSLQLIALGLGTQNYTCASTTSTPVSDGAKANLYDATAILTAASRNPFASTFATNQMTCLADHTDYSLGLRQIGVHYFNSALQPNFDLSGVGKYLEAAKLGTAPAPSTACTGRDGNAAVAWLYLGALPGGLSNGLGSVYRVETTGGLATSCAGTTPGQVITSDYSAQYWFYQ